MWGCMTTLHGPLDPGEAFVDMPAVVMAKLLNPLASRRNEPVCHSLNSVALRLYKLLAVFFPPCDARDSLVLVFHTSQPLLLWASTTWASRRFTCSTRVQ